MFICGSYMYGVFKNANVMYRFSASLLLIKCTGHNQIFDRLRALSVAIFLVSRLLMTFMLFSCINGQISNANTTMDQTSLFRSRLILVIHFPQAIKNTASCLQLCKLYLFVDHYQAVVVFTKYPVCTNTNASEFSKRGYAKLPLSLILVYNECTVLKEK